MADLRQQTIDVYNNNAQGMADKFRAEPPRLKHISLALEACKKPKPRVLEIGCGDGRDAKEIVARTEWYRGIDISTELIKLAEDYVPEADFEAADAVEYDYPNNLDVIIAFASFIHLDKTEFTNVLNKLYASLNEEGVVYLSLKWAPDYKMETNTDRFGERQYYFYDESTIHDLAGKLFTVEKSWHETRPSANHPEWLEVILKKV